MKLEEIEAMLADDSGKEWKLVFGNPVIIAAAPTIIKELVERVRKLEKVADIASDILKEEQLSDDCQTVTIPETLTYILSSALAETKEST